MRKAYGNIASNSYDERSDCTTTTLQYPQTETVLTHQAAKPLKRPGNAHMRVDLDEDAAGGVYVYLQQPGFVERRVEQSEETLQGRSASSSSSSHTTGLMRNVRPRVRNIAPGLCENALVVVAIQKCVLCVPAAL